MSSVSGFSSQQGAQDQTHTPSSPALPSLCPILPTPHILKILTFGQHWKSASKAILAILGDDLHWPFACISYSKNAVNMLCSIFMTPYTSSMLAIYC